MNGGDGCGEEGEGRLVTELEVVLRDKVKFNKEKEEKEEKIDLGVRWSKS